MLSIKEQFYPSHLQMIAFVLLKKTVPIKIV